MNLFPCSTIIRDGAGHESVHANTRVIYYGAAGTVVWEWQGQGPVAIAVSAKRPKADAGDLNAFTLDDPAAAEPVEIRHTPGSCGCGHPLKHYTSIPHPTSGETGGASRVTSYNDVVR